MFVIFVNFVIHSYLPAVVVAGKNYKEIKAIPKNSIFFYSPAVVVAAVVVAINTNI
jgi:hypothetical protein